MPAGHPGRRSSARSSVRIIELRKTIDEIDSQILRLLNRRAELVLEVGRLKAEQNLEYHVPQREEEIYARLAGENTGPFPVQAVRPVFREVISACLSLEHPLRVAYLGPRATFSHLAAMERFGLSAQFLAMRSIGEVFAEVEKGNADYGAVPVENSTEGIVSHTLDMFVDSSLLICGEVVVETALHLLSRAGSLAEIRQIYSHPHALAEARKWLETHSPHIPVIETSSTAAAAETAASEPGAAAIASELAASLYGLTILQRRIEDHPNNMTRFLIIGRKPTAPTAADKTSILFSIKDRVGALHRILQPFAEYQINLTKIESRPSKKRVWEYVFYVDFEGHAGEPRVQRALEALRDECIFLKVLGSYPQTRRPQEA
ncbi:MAG: prephenate dehydratase [candidate division NC10 bacterium RIFCSPLOWO2_12_FULL_66_18]|nr:MAG: prephenate dehydratase [candidate division NC10 bacterium RIFCSPLOWO2_02_FULL_66_22]OGB98936.1 MAG: prephenate dehydratase [candidate division NC10 bacterium RIFCSPLOWO2_12_FULL_66_18]